jgi:integration host factor subunit alpha
MTMTKADLIERVYDELKKVSKTEAADLVNTVFDSLKQSLASGENVKISGFGNFVVKEKKPRTGRNPQTGAPITISGRKVINFKVSQILKTSVNPDSVE